jgi:hypothetical protein
VSRSKYVLCRNLSEMEDDFNGKQKLNMQVLFATPAQR